MGPYGSGAASHAKGTTRTTPQIHSPGRRRKALCQAQAPAGKEPSDHSQSKPGRQQAVPKGRGHGRLTDHSQARLTPHAGGGTPRTGFGQRGPTSPNKLIRVGGPWEHPKSD
jgi:hypothetical protein